MKNKTENINKNYPSKNFLKQNNQQNSKNFLQESQSEQNIKIFGEKIREIMNINNEKSLEKLPVFIDKILRDSVRNFIIKSDFSFFKNYKNNSWEIDENRIASKLDKYFPIHQNVFYKIINEEIEKLPENMRTMQYVNNIVKNNIEKYLEILFIFSEKVKISDLENFLRIPLSNISEKFVVARNDINLLEKFEKEESKNIKEIYKIQNWDDSEAFADESFISSMYRHIYREIAKNNENKNTWKEISDKIEESYKKTIDRIFYIFTVWVESGSQKTEDIFKNIEIIIRKLFDWLLFLKKNSIAFEDFPADKINDTFFEEISYRFLPNIQNEYRIVFSVLIKMIFEKNENIRTKMYNEINENLKIIIKSKAKNKIPVKTEFQKSLNIENIDFFQWEKVPEIQKYENVFSHVFAKNWKVKLADFLNLENDEFEKYFYVFSNYWANIKDFKQEEERKKYILNLRKQAKRVVKMQGKDLEKMIKNNVNDLNFLVAWWRFILKTRVSNDFTISNITVINEQSYWVVEKIIEDKEIQEIIEKWRIDFNPEWRVKNTSVKGTTTLLTDLLKWLKKWFIDLSQDTIDLNNNKKEIIWRIRDLYLPRWIESKNFSQNDEIAEIEKYLNTGIDLCFNLLKEWVAQNDNQKEYLKILIEKNILPEWEFTTEDLEKVQNLVEILKFIKNRIRHIIVMLRIAEEDRKILQSNEKIKSLMSVPKSWFGPRKSFARAFEKLVRDYGGDFNRLGDLTRLRLIGDDIDDVVSKVKEFIKVADSINEITHIAISDKTGEPISLPKEASGYRDVKLLLKMKSWNTVEVQFQYAEMLKVKDEWLDLSLNENQDVFEKMKEEDSLLNINELDRILKYAKNRNIELPTKDILTKLTSNKKDLLKINWNEYEDILKVSKISTDYTYHIIRQLPEQSTVRYKLTKLERALADSAWSKIILKYIQKRWIQTKNTTN